MSQFIVSARKYRPYRFDEVVGQSHVTDTLKNALQSDHLAHAFLFTGPRGVGKTSCARILAKAINCENPGDDREPCNTCGSCKSFNDSASFNIIELDAASNNSVDHIRALNEQVRFQPQQGRFKVFIIDEVHMLTQSAFNAFLKTLEEPPPYAVFILATTEKHKIIPTILSRCQVFDFHRIQTKEMANHLHKIAQKEGVDVDEDALLLISQKADGALRDALSIFDRISNVSKGTLDYKTVIDQLNILDYDYYFKFVDACLEEDLDSIMNLYQEVNSKGFEGDLFLLGFSEHLRNLLLSKSNKTQGLLEGSAQLISRYIDQATRTDLSFLMTGLSLSNQFDVNYPRAKNKRLHIEIFLAKLCFMGRALMPEGEPRISEKKKDNPPAQLKVAPPQTHKAEDQIVSDPPKTEIKKEVEPVVTRPEPDLGIKKPVSPSPIGAKMSLNIPKLSSIGDIEKEIQKIEEEEIEIPELNNEVFQNEWKSFVEKIDSPAIKMIFSSVTVLLQDNLIRIDVPSQMTRDTILQDPSFVQNLRDKYSRPDIKLDIHLDEEKAKELKQLNQKPLTYQEKYEQLVSINPKVSDLQKKFMLKPDKE